jgi:sulfur-oxidizing protein SoxA
MTLGGRKFMKKLITSIAVLAIGLTSIATVQASPAEDREAFRNYFKKNMPSADLDDYVNGIYAFNKDAREQWQEIEEFPPYEIAIDKGEELWSKKFKNGKSFTDCFGDVSKVRAKYPYHDEAKDDIVTLEGTINKCLTDNGEKPFKWKKGNIAAVSAYVAYQGRGGKIVTEPKTEKAVAWYNKGKNFFYAKRGQLNLSCADCHVYSASKWIRGDNLSSALGHPSHFPVFRSKWGNLGTLHRRYGGCNKQVRAKPFKAQSKEYKALEYFQAVMSNGLELNGPGARK